MTLGLLWFGFMLAAPLSVAALQLAGVRTERLRTAAVATAGVTAGVGLLALWVPEIAAFRLDWPDVPVLPLRGAAFAVTRLSAPLVALPATLWWITVAATPRTRLDRKGIARTALATATLTCAFLTQNPIVLAIVWIASNALFLRALSPTEHRGVRRSASVYLQMSTGLFVAGVALMELHAIPGGRDAGVVLILGAVLIRKGIFPFHAWIPHAFDRGRIGPTVLFCAPQLGTYVAAVVVVPLVGQDVLRALTVLSLVTAVYGAALALVQHDARRATGYIFVSQSALVFAGLDCTSREALAGSLVLWLSSALAFTGMARTVLALEARRGRLDLRTHHGGYDQMPLLASGFLVLALACTGFPGTLGFVGEEMLLEGAMQAFPILGLMVVAASALTGLAVLRMYFSLFCGRRPGGVRLALRRGEAMVIGALATSLLVMGLFPRATVHSRLEAAQTVLEHTLAEGH